jgi:hypothetical protein
MIGTIVSKGNNIYKNTSIFVLSPKSGPNDGIKIKPTYFGWSKKIVRKDFCIIVFFV